MSRTKNPKSDFPAQVCILWQSPQASPCDSLLRVLSDRGFAVSPASSQYQAFAGVSAAAKAARRVVLVLDDRESLVGVDRVLDGLERFVPEVICWEHRVGQNPPMVPVVRIEAARTTAPSVEPVSPKTKTKTKTKTPVNASANKLRLVGDEPEPAAPSIKAPKVTLPKKSSGALSSSDVLDADELDALLAGEYDDRRHGKK